MPYRKRAFLRPPYHSDGRSAYVWWNRKRIKLGPWDGQGTPSTPVLQKYLRTVALLEEQWNAEQAGAGQIEDASEVPIAVVVAEYLRWLEATAREEGGDRNPDGTLSTHHERAVTHLRPLVRMFGDLPAASFSTKHLKAYRSAIRSGSWWLAEQAKPGERKPKPWGVSYTNTACANVLRLFGWLESEGHIAEGKRKHLETLPRLQTLEKHETQAAADHDVAATLPHCSPTVRAMLELIRLTAMRPGELFVMRPMDLERSGEVWVYSPAQHKNRWRGHPRMIPIGPDAQAILEPFLDRPKDAYLFSPRESREWWSRQQSAHAGEGRTTPVYPSELRARAKRKAKRKMAKKKRSPGNRYTKWSFRRAVGYAIARARRAGEDVTDWTPYQLRHARITEVQDQMGWSAAQAVAGHESLQATKRYAHLRFQRALRIAAGTQHRPRKAK